jgi:putative transport protein
LFVVGIGFLLAWVAGNVLALPIGASAGLLAGALTSSPTLAAAQDAVRSGLVALPVGWSPEAALASIGASYAITYLVGTLGIL